MKLFRLIPAALIGASLFSCEQDSAIGSSVIQDRVEVVIDSSFTVTGSSVINPVIQARTDNQLLGIIDAKGFGRLSSDFISQLMPSNTIDTVGVTVNDIDSLKMFLYMGKSDMIGDSLVPMGLEVYRVTKALPSPIYSNFDPETYYSQNEKLASTVYSASVLGLSDARRDTIVLPDTMRIVEIKLPVELGREFYTKYKQDPSLFSDPERFSKWFPGLYIKNSFGSGRLMRFSTSLVSIYYRKKVAMETKDTIYNLANPFLAVTPEVINNNNMTLSVSNELKTLAATTPVVAAPIGYDAEIHIPIQDIIDKYHSNTNSYSVVNAMTLEIPASEIANDYGITPPANLLLVKKSEKDEFFADQQIYDNRTSFYATYNATTQSYVFSSMRQYFLDMYNKEAIEEGDGDFVLTAVTPVTEVSQSGYTQQTVIMAIVPYVSTPAMAKLNLEKAKIKLTFSKQTM